MYCKLRRFKFTKSRQSVGHLFSVDEVFSVVVFRLLWDTDGVRTVSDICVEEHSSVARGFSPQRIVLKITASQDPRKYHYSALVHSFRSG